MSWKTLRLFLGVVILAMASGKRLSPPAELEVIFHSANHHDDCQMYCDSMGSCKSAIYNEGTCRGLISPTAVLPGSDESGLLQTGCDVTYDVNCGYQVPTIMYGDCTNGLPQSESCEPVCSENCTFVQTLCEGTCQPLLEIELTFDTPTLLLQVLDQFITELRSEMATFLHVREARLVFGAPREGSISGTHIVILTITPIAGEPTTTLLESLADNVDRPNGEFVKMSNIRILTCVEGCDRIERRLDFSFDNHQLIRPMSEETYSGFGRSMAQVGDTLVVSCEGCGTSGAAFVFTKNTTGDWIESQRLERNFHVDLVFGHSVAMSDAIPNFIFIGGQDDPGDGGQNEGQVAPVWIFERDLPGGLYTNTGIIMPPERPQFPQAGFGKSLALYDTTLVVGARYINSGAVFIYEVENGSQLTHLQTFQGSENELLGSSVAISSSYLLVGSTMYGDFERGSVSVYQRNSTGWNFLQRLTPQFRPGDFGFSVAISDDEKTIAVGDPDYESETGETYIYTRDEGASSWIHQQSFVGSGSFDYFGVSISFFENDFLFIGASSFRSGAQGGAVQFVEKDGATNEWVLNTRIIPQVASVPFGREVVVSDNTLLVADLDYTDLTSNNQGAVFIYDM